jgi:DNA-binding CsgD family transcriptional regulator
VTHDCATQVRQFERLANGPMDLAALPQKLLDALARLVPFDAFCWGAVDPTSLLPTRATGTTVPHSTQAIWEIHELVARGVVPRDVRPLARSGRYVARLSEIIDERSEHSTVYERVLRPRGLEHQLRAALVADDTHWGLLHIERRRPDFSAHEATLLDKLVPHLADAFRRWILADPKQPTATTTPAIPGVIVLDQDNEVDSISPEAEHWLSDWGFADLRIPPSAIAAVVGAARARTDRNHNGIIPSARVRLPTGIWLHVRATHLTRRNGKPRTAIVLERARHDELAPLIARAHQLSRRETQIALLVLRGLSTNVIATELFISPYTVQDHLKSIFEKVGVRSRRDLAADIFEPHLQAA